MTVILTCSAWRKEDIKEKVTQKLYVKRRSDIALEWILSNCNFNQEGKAVTVQRAIEAMSCSKQVRVHNATVDTLGSLPAAESTPRFIIITRLWRALKNILSSWAWATGSQNRLLSTAVTQWALTVEKNMSRGSLVTGRLVKFCESLGERWWGPKLKHCYVGGGGRINARAISKAN